MRSKMSNRILKVSDLGFRVLRKLDTGGTDLVVYQATSSFNIRVAGTINAGAPGFCHLEFTVEKADCVITGLDSSVVNTSNSCGYVSFVYTNDYGSDVEVTVIIEDFVLESGRPADKYNLYLNGQCARTDLPPLV